MQSEEQNNKTDESALARDDYDSAWAEEPRSRENAEQENDASAAAHVAAPEEQSPESNSFPGRDVADAAESETTDAPDWEHKFKSEAGRRRKAEDELTELRRRMDALEQRAAPQADSSAAAPRVDPEIQAFAERGEVEAEFAKKYRDLVPIVSEDSRVGHLLRRRLEEYGADEAAMMATPIYEGRAGQIQAQAQILAQREETARARQNQFVSEIYAQHPDIIERLNSGEGQAMFQELESYAKGHPYEEAAQMLAVLEGSDARALNALLSKFKNDRQSPPNDTQRRAIAGALSAVPSRGAARPRPNGASDKTGYEQAWAEDD